MAGHLAVGETVILLHPPLLLLGVLIGIERGCYQMTVSPTATATVWFLATMASAAPSIISCVMRLPNAFQLRHPIGWRCPSHMRGHGRLEADRARCHQREVSMGCRGLQLERKCKVRVWERAVGESCGRELWERAVGESGPPVPDWNPLESSHARAHRLLGQAVPSRLVLAAVRVRRAPARRPGGSRGGRAAREEQRAGGDGIAQHREG